MKVVAKILGAIEVLVALLAAYVVVSVSIGFLGDDKYAHEWGGLVIPLYSVIAAVFGWAGYILLRRETGAWKHQLFPLAAAVLIAVFFLWADVLSV